MLMTVPSFQSLGTYPDVHTWLQIWHNNWTASSPFAFSISAAIPSAAGDLLFFRILIAFHTSCSLKSLRLMRRMDSGSFGCAGFVGPGQLNTSQKCCSNLTSFFSLSDRRASSLALIGSDLEEVVQVTLLAMQHNFLMSLQVAASSVVSACLFSNPHLSHQAMHLTSLSFFAYSWYFTVLFVEL